MSRETRQIKLQTFHQILLIAFAFTIPFNLQLPFTNVKPNNIFLILLTATSMLLHISPIQNTKSNRKKAMLLFISLYLLLLVAVCYSSNLDQALSDLLEKKISLLIFPIMFYFTPFLNGSVIKSILLAFVSGCALTSVYCLSVAAYRFVILDTSFLTYHDLSELADMHAIYLAMCLCFSLAIVAYYYSEQAIHAVSKPKSIMFFSVMFLLAMTIFFLSARTHILLLILSAIGYSIYFFKRKNSLIISLGKSFGVGVVIFLFVLLFPQNRERFKQLINYKGQYGISQQWGEQQMRPFMWACSFKLIKTAPIIGLGTGDVIDELHQCYVDNNYTTLTYFEGVRFNAHNQFLETTLTLGLIGLIVFTLMLYYSFKSAITRAKPVHAFFLIIFIGSCLTESILERHNGVIFFAFFNSLLFFNPVPLPPSNKSCYK